MLSRGVPEGEIKENLAKEGYSKEDMDEVFAPHKYDMRSWYLLFAIVFLLLGFWALLRYKRVFVLGFSVLLFVQYYRETERLKK